MDTEWMGRYKNLVAAMIMHSNVVVKGLADRRDIGDGIMLNTQELQTLEYVLDRKDENYSMNEAARALGIPPSTFSRIVSKLKRHGLISRFQTVDNRKNIILRPTQYAEDVYSRFDNSKILDIFRTFFKDLEPLSDEDIEIAAKALERFAKSLPSAPAENENELVRIE